MSDMRTFINTSSRPRQSRICTPSTTRREVAESAAIMEEHLDSRRPAARMVNKTTVGQFHVTAGPSLTPQDIEDSNSLCQIDSNVSLIDVSFEEFGFYSNTDQLAFSNPETWPETL